MKNYEGKGHKVVMDNYYTSQKLFRELKNRGIGSLGTIRHNRVHIIIIILRLDLQNKILFQNIFNKFIINKIMLIISINQLIVFYFISKEQLIKKLPYSQHMLTIQSMLIINGIYQKMSNIQLTQISLTWFIYIISTVVV